MIGEKIRQLRKLAGISQVELAKKCDITHSAINQIENGKRIDIRLTTAAKIAVALRVSLDEIAGFNPVSEPDLKTELLTAQNKLSRIQSILDGELC